MAAKERIQFVDSISANPVVRLSLSIAPWGVLKDGTSIPPPPLTRAINSTLLQDGAVIPAAAYENRTLNLHLELDANDPLTSATQLQKLHWELNRPSNILMWQPEPSLPAMYFKTYRAPDYTAEIDYGINRYDVQLQLPAEPFAFGLKEDFGPVVVSSDITAGSNGRYFDLTNIKGDVEVPLQLRFVGSEVANRQTVFGVRRRGTPSAMPLFLQAEAMTQGTDTATSAQGSAYNPTSGNNTSITTFASSQALAQRLSSAVFPASASVDVRGTYQVFFRGLPTFGGTTNPLNPNIVTVELRHGVRAIRNKSVTLQRVISLQSIPLKELGLVQIPEGNDPVTNGPDGAALSTAGVPLSIWMSQSASTEDMLMDHLFFVPADDKYCVVSWSASVPTTYVLDGTNRAIYGLDGSGNITDTLSTSFVGDTPYASPGVTNRIVVIRDVSPDNSNIADGPSASLTISGSYWPRYLTVRPLTT